MPRVKKSNSGDAEGRKPEWPVGKDRERPEATETLRQRRDEREKQKSKNSDRAIAIASIVAIGPHSRHIPLLIRLDPKRNRPTTHRTILDIVGGTARRIDHRRRQST